MAKPKKKKNHKFGGFPSGDVSKILGVRWQINRISSLLAESTPYELATKVRNWDRRMRDERVADYSDEKFREEEKARA